MKVGIVGESGSGKDVLAEILVRGYGFKHFSLSSILREEARGIFSYEPDRNELSRFADQLRREHGETYLLDKTPVSHADRIAVSGIYAHAEVEKIRSLGGVIVAVVADPEIKYERIKKRGTSRDQAINSFEEFVAQSTSELDGSGYEGRASVGEADIVLENNGSLKDLHNAVHQLIPRSYASSSNVNLGVVLTSMP